MRVLIDCQTLSTPEVHRGIGTYLLSNLEQMVRSGMHSITLAVYDDYDQQSIETIRHAVSIVSLGAKLDFGPGFNDEFTRRMADLVTERDIDVLWVPNSLMLNVHSLRGKPLCKTVLTVHDLIPLIFEDMIMKRQWSEAARRLYRQKLIDVDEVFDCVLAVSQSTKKDLLEHLHLNPEKVEVIHEGYKNTSRSLIPREKIENKYGVKNYIYYIGGFDPRKNMENSVLAFKRLIDRYDVADLHYLITCSLDDQSRTRFAELLAKNGLTDRVQLTGYLDDCELLSTLKYAKVFFFPSLYEGFGLPLVEAMALGVPIAASNCSSIPEVAGSSGLYFNPDDLDDMAEVLYRVVADADLAERLGQNGVIQAGRFTWAECSEKTVELFTRTFKCSIEEKLKGRALKIAYFSPLPPQKSGIAVYSEELLPVLKKYVEVDLFVDLGVEPSTDLLQGGFKYYTYTDFPKLAKERGYAAVFYHMGNNTLHKYIYDTLVKYPGITILHDYVLHPFIQHITLLKGDKKTYGDELIYAYPVEGRELADSYSKGVYPPIDLIKFPLNERVVNSSLKVVVHSQYVTGLLNCGDKARLIPLGRDPVDISSETISKYKELLGLADRAPIIGCFGFMNHNKRITVLIDAFSRVIQENPESILLLVGDIDQAYRETLNCKVRDLGLTGSVLITGYKSQEEYYQYLSCTDIVVNLRYPTLGETSKTQLDALAFGKPLLASNIGSYREVPDRCCWKVDVDSTEGDLLFAYLSELAHNDRLRQTMGRNGRDYVRKNHMWDIIVLDYLNLVLDSVC